jgi:hypothetical protein
MHLLAVPILVGSLAVSTALLGAAVDLVEFPSPAPAGSAQHSLRTLADGDAVLSWVEGEAGVRQSLRFAVLSAGGWSEPSTAVTALALLDRPAVVPLGGGALGAGWIASTKSGEAAEAKHVVLARSNDGGETFGPGQRASSHPEAEPYNLALDALPDGSLAAVWSDGRLGGTQALMSRWLSRSSARRCRSTATSARAASRIRPARTKGWSRSIATGSRATCAISRSFGGANAGGPDLPQFLPGDGRAVYLGFEVRAGRR